MPADLTVPIDAGRESFRWIHRRLPVARVDPPALAERSPVPAACADLDGLRISLSGRSWSLDAALAATATDAFLVWHDGTVIHEAYFGGMAADDPHLLQSVTKTFVGAVAGRLAAAGALDLARPVGGYVAELAGTAYGSATVRDLLDMRSGVHFVCDYTDPKSHWAGLSRASGWVAGAETPEGQHEYVRQLCLARPHGGHFEYRSSESAVLAWVCEQVTGTTFDRLLTQLLWIPMGAEAPAFMAVDPYGAPMAERGLCATARDVVRFATAWLPDGPIGRQVLAPGWIQDTARADEGTRRAFDDHPARRLLGPRSHYRNQVWVGSDEPAVLYFTGIHGQLVLVDAAARLVVVKLSSQPVASDVETMQLQLAVLAAIRDAVTAGN